MRTIVLRKTVGPFSAGTSVTIKDRDSKSKMSVVTSHDKVYTVDDDCLIALRDRTDLVPVNNREKRRADSGKRQLWLMLNR